MHPIQYIGSGWHPCLLAMAITVLTTHQLLQSASASATVFLYPNDSMTVNVSCVGNTRQGMAMLAWYIQTVTLTPLGQLYNTFASGTNLTEINITEPEQTPQSQHAPSHLTRQTWISCRCVGFVSCCEGPMQSHSVSWGKLLVALHCLLWPARNTTSSTTSTAFRALALSL